MKRRYFALFTLAALMLGMSACSQDRGNNDETSTDTTLSEEISDTAPITSVPETTTGNTIELTPVTTDDIPAFSGGTKKQDYNCGDGVYMRRIEMVLGSELSSFIKGLPALGYTQTSERETNGNLFYSFKKDGTALLVSFFKYDKIVNLTVLPYDPYDAYADIYSDGGASGTMEPMITMVGLADQEKNGMSFIIRTTTGSFILIDGGWSGVGEGKNILSILKEQNTSDGLPVVAAWILTHPHSDHIGGMSDIAAAYYDEIDLRRVIFNFTDDELLAQSDSKSMLESGSSALNVIRNTLNNQKKWGNAQVIKPHTGDVLYIDGVKVEILQTHEDVFPDTDALLYNNAASMAFKVTTDEHSVLFTGDLSAKYMLSLANRYGSTLKSDILQANHHGRTHGKTEVYSLVSPNVVLWPTTAASFEEYRDKDYNQYLLNNVSRHYISADGTVTLSLKTLEKIK